MSVKSSNVLFSKPYPIYLTFLSSENIPALGGDVPCLNLLLKFITTNLHVPPTGVERRISIQFLKPNERLPDAKSCFSILLLPTVHSNKDEFDRALLTSLRHASCSFAAGF